MIKPAYSVSFLLSINIFVWQNVLYFLDAPRNTAGKRFIAELILVTVSSVLPAAYFAPTEKKRRPV